MEKTGLDFKSVNDNILYKPVYLYSTTNSYIYILDIYN